MFGHDDHSQHQQPADNNAVTNDQVVGTPPLDDTAGDFIDNAPGSTTSPTPAVQPQAPAEATLPTVASPAGSPNADALLSIKQQALQQLTPLIGHLEQTPEEKFRTTMMMIQAADNDELIKDAYDAAVQIPDEKVRAQALLDIVNEINYFTHGNNENGTAA